MRPVLANAKNDEALIQMRHALQKYIVKHIKALDCHIQKVSGNLCYPVKPETMALVQNIVTRFRAGASLDSLLGEYGPRPTSAAMTPWCETMINQGTLLMIYTDLEPDDVMAVAQLWQWKAETKKMQGQPLLIAHANFEDKDGGEIWENKQMMVATMLGVREYYTLTKEGDDGAQKYERDESIHPQNQALAAARDHTVHAICEKLVQFTGDSIELFVLAPGCGNLGAIVSKLKSWGHWPLKARWSVKLYSGSFNMKGMTDADIEALESVMSCSDVPLIDVGKFPFFGGKDYHRWTDSLTTFAMPSFAKHVARSYPVVAALLKKFNDEFNEGLIKPKDSLFKGKTLTDEQKERLARLKTIFRYGDPNAVQQWCKAMVEDSDLFALVAGFKKSTFLAMAYGGCDAPLCDQLLFLYEWMVQEAPESLVATEGYWKFNKEKGFTMVTQEPTGSFRAIQPVLKEPKDEQVLVRMRHALETYFLRHLKLMHLDVSGAEAR